MTEDETGMTALMIPALPTNSDLIEVAIRPAARDHLLAWDASQRLVAIHEAGHCCAAAAAGIPVRSVDVTNRHGGLTQFGGFVEDTSIPWETAGRMLDNIVATLAGAAAERVVLGEHTNGCESDNDRAVALAMRFILAGFGGPGLFIGQDGLPHGYLTSEIRTRTLLRIQEIVTECQAKADALMAKHEDALLIVATAIYEHRRLADERLDAVLQSAGFTLPRPTA